MGFRKNIRRVTPYVPGEQPQEKVIKLNTNENPYPPSAKVQETLAGLDPAKLRLYPDPAATKLVTALADYYGVSQEEVFVGVGSDDVLAMCFLTFFNGEKPVLFPDVTYSFYKVWVELFKIPFSCQPVDENFKIVKTDYFASNGGIIIPNPNAPTGIFESLAVIEEIVARNPDSVVIIDEAYIDFGGESALPLIRKYPNLLVVQTYSKSRSLAGLRVGYALGNRELIKALNDVKYSYNSYTMNEYAIELGAAVLKDEAYFKETTGQIIETREWAKKELEKRGFTCLDSRTNFIFAKHERVPAKEIFEKLKEKGIYVRFWSDERIKDYLRITVGMRVEMEKLLAEIEGILA
ncbi:histidinol-phosphate aminotransferase [Lachnospiraceae bacterium PFB1-21]